MILTVKVIDVINYLILNFYKNEVMKNLHTFNEAVKLFRFFKGCLLYKKRSSSFEIQTKK